MDEISLYNRPLSGEEVQQIYQAGARGKCDPIWPPVILNVPEEKWLAVGSTARLESVVTGTLPLFYQWFLNGQPLAGETNANLEINPVTQASEGFYSLLVSNAGGVANGTIASIWTLSDGCAAMRQGLLGWRPGDDSGEDLIGGNHARLSNGVAFAEGKVAGAFHFNGINSTITIPTNSTYHIQSFTLEGWIFPRADRRFQALAEFSKPVGLTRFDGHLVRGGAH